MKARYNAHLREAPYPSGKGAVCKTAMQRFEPARRLQFLSALSSRQESEPVKILYATGVVI